MKKNMKFMSLILILLLFSGMLIGCGDKDDEKSDSKGDKVNVTFILVLEDKTETKYNVSVTDGSTLRDALFEAELITEDTYYDMFVSDIDGHVADAVNDGVTWMPCDENKEQIMGSFDEITVSSGETIYLIYTEVPNFDD